MIALNNNSRDSIISKEKLLHKVSLLFFLFGYFWLNLTNALIKGGRWDLYEHIAMADRFLAGKGFYYSATEASSPYFPGVGFLAVLVGKIDYAHRDIIMLVIANLIGSLFVYCMIRLGIEFSGQKIRGGGIACLLAVALIMVFQLQNYQTYMNEFKADSLLLVFGIMIMLIFDKIECSENKDYNFISWIAIFVLALLMNIIKQQALFVDIALGIYVLVQRQINFERKVYLLSPVLIAGIIDVVVLFSIPLSSLKTIEEISAMAFRGIKENIYILLVSFRRDYLVYVLGFVFLLIFFLGKYKFDKLSTKYGLIAFVFLGAQMAGTFKEGGNAGNLQVGLAGCLPFICVAANFLYERYISADRKAEFNVVMLVLVLILDIILCHKAYKQIDGVREAFRTNNEIIATLTKYAGGEEIIYYSNQYMNVERSEAIPAVDTQTIPATMGEYMNTLPELFNCRKYKVLYINRGYLKQMEEEDRKYYGYETEILKALNDNYEQIVGDDVVTAADAELYRLK